MEERRSLTVRCPEMLGDHPGSFLGCRWVNAVPQDVDERIEEHEPPLKLFKVKRLYFFCFL